jgi:hypothetical protein
MEEDDIEEDDMEEDVVEDLRFCTNTSNVTHITVEVSTIDLKSQSTTCKTYFSNKWKLKLHDLLQKLGVALHNVMILSATYLCIFI